MERYTMFLDWKNQYCQNDYTTQGNLQIQCNPYQITNGIFHRTRTDRKSVVQGKSVDLGGRRIIKKKNLPKETKDLYPKNYKTLMKEIEDDTN